MSPCERITDANGKPIGFVCTRGRRPQPKCACGRTAKYQCDAPGADDCGTCDTWICARCATFANRIADTHFCGAHEGLKDVTKVELEAMVRG